MLLSEAQSLRAGDEIWEVCFSHHDGRIVVLKFFFVRKHCDDVECDLFAVERVKNESHGYPATLHLVHVDNIYGDLDSAKAAAVARMLRCTDET